jgi:hypothetical protein
MLLIAQRTGAVFGCGRFYATVATVDFKGTSVKNTPPVHLDMTWLKKHVSLLPPLRFFQALPKASVVFG